MSDRTIDSHEQDMLDKAARFLPGGSNGNTIYQGLVVKKARAPGSGTSAATSTSTTRSAPGP